MTGRGRGRGRRGARGGRRAQDVESSPEPGVTTREDAEIDPQIMAGSMGPPPARVTRSLRNQGKEPELTVDIARRSAPKNNIPSYLSEVEAATTFTDPTSMVSASTNAALTPSKMKAMRALLPRLFTATEDVFAHLTRPADGAHEEWMDQLEMLDDLFNTHRKYFLKWPGAPFIEQQAALTTQGLAKDSDGWDYALRILVAANYVTLLEDIATFNQPPEGGSVEANQLTVLQRWDAAFPLCFSYRDPHDPEDTVVLDQALNIRTYLLMLTLRDISSHVPPDHDPYTEVCRLFFEDTTAAELRDGIDWAAVTFKPFYGFNVNEAGASRERVAGRIAEICEAVGQQDATVAWSALEGMNDGVLDSLRVYGVNCYTAIQRSIKQGDSSGLSHTGFDQALASQVSSQLEDDARQRYHTEARLAQLAEFAGIQALNQSDEEQQRLATEQILARHNELQSSYPGPSSMSYSQNSGAMYAQSAAAGSSKRPAPDDDDGEFEMDIRTPDTKRRRPARPRKKRTTDVDLDPEQLRALNDPDYMTPGSQQDLDIDALTQRSREVAAEMRSKKPKEPQTRTPWSRNDYRMLVKAVAIFQCKWSQIEAAISQGKIHFEHPRDQQALRDKARLIKQDILKSDGMLHPGFDGVVLGKKERNAVIACGKNPDRKEADVMNGVPVNTQYGGGAAPIPASQAESVIEAIPQDDAVHIQPVPVMQPEADMDMDPALQAEAALQQHAGMHQDPNMHQHPALHGEQVMHPEAVVDPELEAQDHPIETLEDAGAEDASGEDVAEVAGM